MSTFFDLCLQGGVFMIPLVIVAATGIVLFVERIIFLKHNRIDGDKCHFELKTSLKEEGIEKAIVLAAKTRGMIGRVLEEGLIRIKGGETNVETATEKILIAEMEEMEKSRGWMVTLAVIAPLLGILGTVYGLIIAFMAIEVSASTDPKVLASGIYQALVTTVAGLVIAIFLTLAVEYIRNETNRILHWLDLYLAEVKDWLKQADRGVTADAKA